MLYNQEWDKQTPTLMSKLLDTAADLIEQYGHTKKQLYGKDGSMCFMGAIHRAEDMVASSGKIMRGEAAEHVMKAMGMVAASYPGMDTYEFYRHRPDPVMTMVEWNNAPERTGQEVIDAFRLAAKVPVAADV
jgi:hypothetical protein